MTPVEVIKLLFNFTPEVGGDISKIAVTATMRLHFTVQVSSILTIEELLISLLISRVCVVPKASAAVRVHGDEGAGRRPD